PHKHLKILKEDLQPVRSFLCMIMAAVPSAVIQSVLDPVEPLFCGFVYAALIDAGQKYFSRLIFQRSRMAQDHVYVPAAAVQLPLHVLPDFFRRLLVRPPAVSVSYPEHLIDAVRTA